MEDHIVVEPYCAHTGFTVKLLSGAGDVRDQFIDSTGLDYFSTLDKAIEVAVEKARLFSTDITVFHTCWHV